MSTPNQPRYTPADIERYLNGKMSAEESYALEQAAWQDPLLEEAIEGFLAAKEQSVSATPHLQSLEERIKRASQQNPASTSSAHVVPMTSSSGWKSIAAALLALSALSLGLWMMFRPTNEAITPIAVAKQDTPNTQARAQEPDAKIILPAPSTNPVAPTSQPSLKAVENIPPVLTESRVPSPINESQVPSPISESQVPLPITEAATDAYKPAPTIAQVQAKSPIPVMQEPNEDLQAERNQEITAVEIAATNQAPRNMNVNDQRVKAAEIVRQAYLSKESNKKRAKSEADIDNGVRLPTRRNVSEGLSPVGGWEKLEQGLADQILQHPNCTGMRGQLVTVVLTEEITASSDTRWRIQTKRISAACEQQLLQFLREQRWEYQGKAPNPEIQWLF